MKLWALLHSPLGFRPLRADLGECHPRSSAGADGLAWTTARPVEPTDVVLLFSQDQDFAELADEVRAIAREQQRWLKIASAYPRIR